MFELEIFFQSFINGIAVGTIYSLVALGFVLIYKSTETINFALGDLLMLSAFAAWTLSVPLGWPLWIAITVSVLVTGSVAGVLNASIVSRIVGQPQFAHVLLTIGIAFALRGLIFMFWGVDQRTLGTLAPDGTLNVFGLLLRAEHAQIILVAVFLVVALNLFFKKTLTGLAMQAVAENQLASYLMAIPVQRFIVGVWVLAGAVAGMAGVLLAPLLLVDGNLWLVVVKGLIVAVIGGFHSIPGALIAGVLIGLIEQLAGVYLDSEYRELTVYGLFFVILAVFPRGLFGGPAGKRV